MNLQSQIVIFEAPDQPVQVRLEDNTVWLSQPQMAELFGRERGDAFVALLGNLEQSVFGEPVINDVGLAPLEAESDAKAKDVMIHLIENMLALPAREAV